MSALSRSQNIFDRIAASVFFNFCRSGMSFATGMLIARWLGPEEFGRIAFIIGSFIAFRQLVDMASSSAFFTFLSERKRGQKLIRYFWLWVFIQLVVSTCFLLFILPENLIANLWLGERKSVLVLGLLAALMQHHVWGIASQMAEAQRETIKVQQLGLLVSVVHFFSMVCLWFFGALIVPIIFAAIIIEWCIASVIASRMYEPIREIDMDLRDETTAGIFREFWHYCAPLIPYAWLSFAHDFAERWMLQKWSGAIEQAYFATSNQIAGVILLATSSFIKVFWKEIAEAWFSKKQDFIIVFFKKITNASLLISGIIVGGLVPASESIIFLLLGTQYAAGHATLSVMLFYPIHQSLGQLTSTVFMATGKTRLYVISNVAFLILSSGCTYYLLAPTDYAFPGLGLTSTGFAVKLVLLQFIQVNFLAWLICRIFGGEFNFFLQFWSVGLFLCLGYASQGIASFLFVGTHVSAFVGGIFYVTFCFLIFLLVVKLLFRGPSKARVWFFGE